MIQLSSLVFVLLYIGKSFGCKQLQKGWDRMDGALKSISVAYDGTVWGVNDDDAIYYRDFDQNDWIRVSDGRLKQISVGDYGTIWGVNDDDSIYYRDFDRASWTKVSGALKHVSVAADGTVWGVNDGDSIYYRDFDRGSWTKVSGALKQISVGSSDIVWGVNDNDSIYYRDFDQNSWVQVSGRLKYVDVNAENDVWGVNDNDAIYHYEEIDGSMEWVQYCGGLAAISVGRYGILWGVNGDDAVYSGDSEKIEIVSITFDVDQYDLYEDAPLALASVICDNTDGSNEAGTVTFQVAEDITSTSSFSYMAGVSIEVGTEFTTGIPHIAEGKVSVSVTASFEHTWGTETTISNMFSASYEVPCAIGEKIRGTASVHAAVLVVPYTMITQATPSGTQYTSSGEWTGTTYYDLHNELVNIT